MMDNYINDLYINNITENFSIGLFESEFENFKSLYFRNEVLNEAVDIKGLLGKIKDRIIKFFKDLFTKIKDFFKNIIDRIKILFIR